MKPGVVLLIIAVLAAGATAMLSKLWLDKQSIALQNGVPQAIEVMVAARTMATGNTVQSDDLRYDRWPASLFSPHLIVRKGTEDGRAAFAGQIVRRLLREGEPFTAEATAKRDNVGLMAAMLTPGMRAMSIAISNPSAVSGFVTPGDHVDVVVAADLSHTLEGRRPPPTDKLLRYAAETILKDIRVLAIDQQIARNAEGSAVQGKTATLEVSPAQVEILTVASLLGTLQLVLHGKEDTNDQATLAAGFSGDMEISSALRNLLASRPEANSPEASGVVLRSKGTVVHVNRAGAVSEEEFKK
ncbi:MAG: Flp pilus assembly protein CpaB [Alphaproteobacteria bacterium]|nr:Flp pilus assembly protein CpaB [Alphaproteobacteria bacterium]